MATTLIIHILNMSPNPETLHMITDYHWHPHQNAHQTFYFQTNCNFKYSGINIKHFFISSWVYLFCRNYFCSICIWDDNTSKDDHENIRYESSKVHLSKTEHWQPPFQNKTVTNVQTCWNVQQTYLAKPTYIHAENWCIFQLNNWGEKSNRFTL